MFFLSHANNIICTLEKEIYFCPKGLSKFVYCKLKILVSFVRFQIWISDTCGSGDANCGKDCKCGEDCKCAEGKGDNCGCTKDAKKLNLQQQTLKSIQSLL